MVTLDDIARELGISKSTVSKALNGAKDISKKTQQAVIEKAVKLGYTRSVSGNNLPRVAIFILNMDYDTPDSFGNDLILGFRKAAEPAGYQVEIIDLDRSMQESIHYDEYMMQENYCGAFFLGMTLLDPWLKDFETCKTPTVLYDNHVSCNPNVTSVGVDNVEGIEMAVKHLRNLGHSKIGYLSSSLDAYVYRQRYQAFIHIMTRMGLVADETVMGFSYHVNDCVSKHLPRLLENECTAIICSHDMLANSVLHHCLELGIKIPTDISVMGYDNIPLCQYTIPPLTTIHQNRLSLGKSAYYALSSHFVGVSLCTHLLHAELVQRSSCGPVPKENVSVRKLSDTPSKNNL